MVQARFQDWEQANKNGSGSGKIPDQEPCIRSSGSGTEQINHRLCLPIAEKESQPFQFVGQQAFGSIIALNALPVAPTRPVALTHIAKPNMRAVWCGCHRTGMV